MLAGQHETFMTARFALYYCPGPDSPWARFGEDWLTHADAREIVEARRYGFHATLKAPFRLAPGTRLEDLIDELDRHCAAQAAFDVPQLVLARLDDFLALVPAAPQPRLDAIAAACVRNFERFRAPPGQDEIARRHRAGLTPLQEANLSRWGYPHVLESFRFHLSLTGRLLGLREPAGEVHWREASVRLAVLGETPLGIDAISVSEEPAAGAPFRVIHRARLGQARSGRLVYLVGPSGAGKDSLLAWARDRLPAEIKVRFARRTITRPAGPGGEDHIAVSEAQFEQRLRDGAYALHWRANGQRYGIGSEIVQWMAAGATVVVNGSREHIPEVRRTFPFVEVVHVAAPEPILRERLAARARENFTQADARMARNAGAFARVDAPSLEIVNDGTVEPAARQLLHFLTTGAPRP